MGLVGGKLSAVAAAILLALFVASCGGDDDESTSSDSTSVAQSQGSDKAQGETTKKKSSESKQSGNSNDSQSGSGSNKKHDDSGGGSSQFKAKGGDNSVQDFGKEAGGSEFDQAAEAVHGFFDARVRGDWKTACSYLAAEVSESLEQLAGNSKKLADAGCAKTMEGISEGVPRSAFVEAAKADIGSLRVEGDQAFVIYVGQNRMVFAMPMKDEGGTWEVASLAGTPLN